MKVFYTRPYEDMTYNNSPARTIAYSFAGYNRPKEFYAPDYRHTLHWCPNIHPDGDGVIGVSFSNLTVRLKTLDFRKTARKLRDKLSSLGVSFATIYTDNWDSF